MREQKLIKLEFKLPSQIKTSCFLFYSDAVGECYWVCVRVCVFSKLEAIQPLLSWEPVGWWMTLSPTGDNSAPNNWLDGPLVQTEVLQSCERGEHTQSWEVPSWAHLDVYPWIKHQTHTHTQKHRLLSIIHIVRVGICFSFLAERNTWQKLFLIYYFNL